MVQPRGSVSVLSTPEEVDQIANEIEALAAVALEPNVFYEPWMLRPALEELSDSGLMIVLVRDGSRTLSGMFPLQLQRRFRGLPLKVLKNWRHTFCFLGTPLISRGQADETVRSLMHWLRSKEAPADILEFELVGMAGPFAEVLTAELRAPGWRSYQMTFERALYKPAENPALGISHKHQKELRRLERRLADRGPLAYRSLEDGDRPLSWWREKFLALEAKGWKGERGTAFDSQGPSRRFFEKIFNEGCEAGKVQMFALTVGDEPVAMKCNLLCPGGAFTFKIAFDEAYADFSPGVLLELHSMLVAVEKKTLWMDSCAVAQHFMINRLWTDRLTMGSYMLAGRGVIARAIVGQWPNYHALRRRLGLKTGGR